jgi:hypothetical protein
VAHVAGLVIDDCLYHSVCWLCVWLFDGEFQNVLARLSNFVATD